MPSRIRLKRGIELRLDNGDVVVFDGSTPGDVTVLSHAHSDHLVRACDAPVVCSRLTATLAAVRNGSTDLDSRSTHQYIDLLDAGHVAGSRAALVTDPASGRQTLYTGDCSTRSRLYLDGFEPPPADVLVIETTYGSPTYRLPRDDELFPAIRDWLAETIDSVVLLFGYSLGRAQKLQQLAIQAGRPRIFVPETVARINEVVATHLDVSFDVRLLAEVESPRDFESGDAVVVPAQMRHRPPISSLLERDRAVTAGFSGWAIEESYRYRTGCDVTFPLSDHCDFDELVDVVHRVDPEIVYTHHGFAEEFATHLTREHGYKTRALKKHQSTLGDF